MSFQNFFDFWLTESIENAFNTVIFIFVGTRYETWIKDPNNHNYIQQKQIEDSSLANFLFFF